MTIHSPIVTVSRIGAYLIAAMTAVGCGAAPELENAEPVQAVTHQQHSLTNDADLAHKSTDSSKLPPVSGETAEWQCIGWSAGARHCLTYCDGMGWQYVGSSPSIPYGQCGNRGSDFCWDHFRRVQLYQCWGIWR